MPSNRTIQADKLSCFPLFMKVEGRVAVIVGNGAEALAKSRLLAESRAAIRLVAPAPSLDLGVFIIQADIDHVAAPFAPAMLDDAAMVFAATGDADADEAIVAAARERNIPANAVDRPELCDFYVPALVNRAPVCVAIGTEGTGPVLTQMLRAKIEALLPASTGPLARLAARYRKTVDRIVPRGAPRRRFWRDFFDGPVARCVATGDMAAARRAAMGLLKNPEAESAPATGFVSLVGAGPGEPDLLTLRAQRALQEADTILFDPAVPESIAALGRRDATRAVIDLSDPAERLAAEAGNGKRVALLVTGDPHSAPLAESIIETLKTSDIAFEIVPGIAASSQAVTAGAATESLAA